MYQHFRGRFIHFLSDDIQTYVYRSNSVRLLHTALQQHFAINSVLLPSEAWDGDFITTQTQVAPTEHDIIGFHSLTLNPLQLSRIAILKSCKILFYYGDISLFGKSKRPQTLSLLNQFDCVMIIDVAMQQQLQQLGIAAQKIFFWPQPLKKRRFSILAQQVLNNLLQYLLPPADAYRNVSIVIATYNRQQDLARCLDYLQLQNNPNFEVIVVNGPSQDQTAAVLAEYKGRIKIHQIEARNLSQARNQGILLATGDIVAFIDDDALAFSDWVDNLLSAYQAVPRKVVGMGGPVYEGGKFSLQSDQLAIDVLASSLPFAAYSQLFSPRYYRTFLGTNCSFKRDILLAAHGFDQQYDYYLDEADLCVRLQQQGWLLAHNPQVWVRHEFARSYNRQGKFDYNWFTICKNTAYFICKFNPELSPPQQERIVHDVINQQRILFFHKQVQRRKITIQQLEQYITAARAGIVQGLLDAKAPRKLMPLLPAEQSFLTYLKNIVAPRSPQRSLHVVLMSNKFEWRQKSSDVGLLYYHLASELLLLGHRVTVFTRGDQESFYQCGRFTMYQLMSVDNLDISDAAGIYTDGLSWSIAVANKIKNLLDQGMVIDVIDASITDLTPYALQQFDFLKLLLIVVRATTPSKLLDSYLPIRCSKLGCELFAITEKKILKQAHVIIGTHAKISARLAQQYSMSRQKWRNQLPGIAYWPNLEVNFNYTEITQVDLRLATIKPQAKKILFLNRLQSVHGIELLLAAATSLLQQFPDIVFLLAGEDPEHYQQRWNDARVPGFERVIFLGPVAPEFRDILLNFVDILVFPAYFTALPMVPLLGFVHGLPVVAADLPTLVDIVIHQINGLLFAPGDDKGLEWCLLQLIKDANLYDRLAQGALQQRLRLSSQKMAQQSVAVYQSLLEVI